MLVSTSVSTVLQRNKAFTRQMGGGKREEREGRRGKRGREKEREKEGER